MADDGNTMWNGKYGADEAKRRDGYDRATERTTKARDMMADMANRRLPEHRQKIREGRDAAEKFVKERKFKYVK